MTLEEELRLDDEENRREAEFIHEQLPTDIKEHFSDDDLLYIIDAIVDYYYESGILETTDDEVEIDCHGSGNQTMEGHLDGLLSHLQYG